MHKALLLGVVVLVAFALPAQAQFAIGGGTAYRGLIMGDLSIRLGNLALAVDVGSASRSQQGVTATAAIASILLKWYFPLEFPVTPFIGAGGVAAGIGLSGQSNGQPVSVTGIGAGGQLAAGAEFQVMGLPLYLGAAAYYSTVDKVAFRLAAGSQSVEFEVPVEGVGGFSFSVGLRYDFISIMPAKEEPVENTGG